MKRMGQVRWGGRQVPHEKREELLGVTPLIFGDGSKCLPLEASLQPMVFSCQPVHLPQVRHNFRSKRPETPHDVTTYLYCGLLCSGANELSTTMMGSHPWPNTTHRLRITPNEEGLR